MVPREQTTIQAYFSRRMERLIEELEETFRVTFSPTKFRESVTCYGEMRRLSTILETHVAHGTLSYATYGHLLRAGAFRPVEMQIAELTLILQSLPDITSSSPIPAGKTPIIVSGILPPPAPVIAAMEEAGLIVVGNDVASERRALNFTPPVTGDPVTYYHDFYDQHWPCTTLLYTADHREAVLKDLIKSTKAAGVVFVGEKFCEYEFFEFPYLEKAFENDGIYSQLLEISIEDDENIGTYATRIEAFAEMMGATKGGKGNGT